MYFNAGWLVSIALVAMLQTFPASAFTTEEINEVFKVMDLDGNGKVNRAEFDNAKINVFYRRAGDKSALTYEDTKVSRKVFDDADTDHNGTLSAVEILDALPFSKVAQEGKSEIDVSDFAAFMNGIAR
jgi:Ca2+-binding EF-hand superfamily protein